jgi:DNA-binding NarL/FixJ family response regulator
VSRTITVALADDHAMFRGALAQTLGREPDIAVVASASNADDAVAEVARLKPDILFLDIDMPGMVCFDAARRTHDLSPHTRVVFLSAFFNDRYIEQALAAKAWGYVVKTAPESAVIDAIRCVASGSSYFSPEVRARLVFEDGAPQLSYTTESRVSTLTEREVEVLRLIARGLSQDEIARSMHISAHTVHHHSTSIRRKLEITSRTELVRFAIREGLAEA